MARLTLDINILPDRMPMEDCTDILRRQAEAKEALRVVQRSAKAQAQIRTLEKHLEEDIAPVGEAPEDSTPKLREAQATVDSLSGAPDRLRACEQARADLGTAEKHLAEQQPAILAATERLASYRATETLLTERLEDLRRQAREAKDGLATAEHERDKARGAVEIHQHALGRCEAILESATKALEAHEAKRRQVQDLATRRGTLDDLVACFGVRGVRQILTDAAAPELEDLADGLFEVATQGRMRLRIATQRLLKDGSTAEDFAIMVKDSAGERDVTAHSGGELQLCAILFRIAVALWIARLKGRKPDCLFLDEAFDRLGAAGADDLMRAIDAMADRFGLIALVTHDPHIAARMRSQVNVTRSAGGARIDMRHPQPGKARHCKDG